ncbi:MAG: hypothetical protein ACSHWN_11590 [Methylophilaceae bacterium]
MKALTGSLEIVAYAYSFNGLGVFSRRLFESTDSLHRFNSSTRSMLHTFFWQFLAIARALLRQPNILIFDEAVSNLDQSTSEQFAQTINKLKGKVTILFITHQLPKGLHVDEAILLGKDAVVKNEQQATNPQPNKIDKAE